MDRSSLSVPQKVDDSITRIIIVPSLTESQTNLANSIADPYKVTTKYGCWEVHHDKQKQRAFVGCEILYVCMYAILANFRAPDAKLLNLETIAGLITPSCLLHC